MEHTKTRGTAVAAVLACAAAVLLTGCRGDDGTVAPPAPTSSASAASPVSSASPVPSASPTPSASAASPASPTSAAPAESPCGDTALEAGPARQAAQRPQGTGTGAAIVGFTNTSGSACTVQGFPTVAGAANGSPELNVPLTVENSGTSAPVTVAPGGRVWVKLTFHQVQGEGDGYCASGEAPVQYPTMVLGLPGAAGRHQVALDDGVFAECDGVVTVTALSAAQPS
ncbi:DUF4232 domain-containing protein [Streptomyces sp. NPDC088733]|uniref:DUF4232 domain-containing protein n=1 Tax=Streptomyces sp. NPDC088733 TaxID=3365880 RepID=UPI0037F7BCF9